MLILFIYAHACHLANTQELSDYHAFMQAYRKPHDYS